MEYVLKEGAGGSFGFVMLLVTSISVGEHPILMVSKSFLSHSGLGLQNVHDG